MKVRKWRVSAHRFFALTLVLSLIIGLFPQGAFAEGDAQPPQLEVRSAVLMDAASGDILYEFNGDTPFPPASMSKMMTEYLVMEAIKSGKLKWDDVITASPYAHFMGSNDGSRVFLADGEQRTVKEMFTAMSVYSANDATVALAEHLGQSEAGFAQLMNEKAKQLGMKDTFFVTASGYPANELGEYAPNTDKDNIMSAKDAAILGRALITDFPEVTDFTSLPVAYFREGEPGTVKMTNFNQLIPGAISPVTGTPINNYEGADGIKTGSTEQAGKCITASAVRNDFRLVAVVMGAETDNKRFQEVSRLLDYGFNNYEKSTFIDAKKEVKGFEQADVKKGKKKEVAVVTEKSFEKAVKKGEGEKAKAQVEWYKDKLVAPIKAGTPVGKLTYTIDGKQVAGEVQLLAKDDVEKAGFIRLFFRGIKDVIVNVFSGIADGVKGIFS